MDDNQIICPECKKPIPLSQAVSHQLREKYRKFIEEDRKKHADAFEKKLLEERESLQKTLSDSIRKRIEGELALKLQDQKNESEELKKQNRDLSEQLLELNKLMRQLRSENEVRKLEMEKKFFAQEEKLKEEIRKRADEENRLRFLEYEKKLTDALRVNEDLKRKLEQGSQQTQGEVLELELEQILQTEFPFDEVKPVGKGITGADIVQIVHNAAGQTCGTIVWESKRTKSWGNDWIEKLKDDQRKMKAEVAVIVSEILPADVKHFSFKEGVWITNYQYMTALALALRRNLIDIALIKAASVGKSEKMEVLYNYIYGTEFRQRIEAIVEAFSSLQNDLEREKRWFAAKWAKQEKQIRKVLDNTIGMHGDLQSIVGNDLGELEGLELELLTDGSEERLVD